MSRPIGVEAHLDSRLLWRLVLMCMAVLLLAQGALSLYALRGFEDELAPQLHRKAEVVGRSVAAQIEEAVQLGIPFDQLVGMDAFLGDIIADNGDILYLAVLDQRGRVLYARDLPKDIADTLGSPPADNGGTDRSPERIEHAAAFDTGLPLVGGGRVVGSLHVGVDKAFVRGQLDDILQDVLTVLVVSLLVTLELLLFFVVVHISAPMRMVRDMLARGGTGDFTRMLKIGSGDEIGRFGGSIDRLVRRLNERFLDLRQEAHEVGAGQIDRGLGAKVDAAVAGLRRRFQFAEPEEESRADSQFGMRIRAPLFLFMFSEELSRSFLPLYVRDLYEPVAGLSVAMVVGLPITVFMATVALMTPVSGILTDRYGARRVFLLAVLPVMAGYAGACFAHGIYDFLVWRALSAVGYGMIFIASQAYIAQSTTAGSRAQGMAIFVGAVAAAGICGPSIGGIIADRIGFRLTFLVSLALALAAAWIVYVALDDQRPTAGQRRRGLRLRDVGILMRDFRFVAVVLFAAIPGKLILAGFLFYLAPLFLFELHNNQPAIGRIMMTYGIATVVLAPLVARWADRLGRHAAFVGLGGIVSGLGCVLVYLALGKLGRAGGHRRPGHRAGGGPAQPAGRDPRDRTGLRSQPRQCHGAGGLPAARAVGHRGGSAGGGSLPRQFRLPDGDRSDWSAGHPLLPGIRTQPAAATRSGAAGAGAARMRRATFVHGLAGALLLGQLPAWAAERTFRIYMVLWRGNTDVEQGFQAYLTERGIRHELIVRDLNTDRSKLPGFVDEIRTLRPDLVYTWGTTSTLGIVGPCDGRDPARFITDIPVVFTLVAYPVVAKLVVADDAPGGNVTGVRFLAPIELQLAAISSYRPFRRLAVIYNPAEQNSLINIAELRQLATAQQFQLIEKPAPLDGSGNPMGDAVPDLVRAAKAEGAEWLYIGPDSFTAVNADSLTGTAVAERLPSFAATELPLKNSQAMSGLVSPYYALGKLTASQAEKILVGGEPPAKLPVAQLARFSLVLNMPVIKQLEFYPPMRVLSIADIVR